jgi:hypothetical protein
MPILERSEEFRSSVECVCEVRVGVPAERLPDVQRFYVALLGLPPWPDRAQLPGGWGAGDLRRGVYFQFRHDPQIEPYRRRFTLIVTSLDAAEKRLAEAGIACWRQHGLNFSDQLILVNDPVGHLIELRQLAAI